MKNMVQRRLQMRVLSEVGKTRLVLRRRERTSVCGMRLESMKLASKRSVWKRSASKRSESRTPASRKWGSRTPVRKSEGE